MYIGSRILNGELPYREIWDHKPPVVFYLNALGLLIKNNSGWGIWLIEYFGVSLAVIIGYLIIKKSCGFFPATISTLLWLLNYFL